MDNHCYFRDKLIIRGWNPFHRCLHPNRNALTWLVLSINGIETFVDFLWIGIFIQDNFAMPLSVLPDEVALQHPWSKIHFKGEIWSWLIFSIALFWNFYRRTFFISECFRHHCLKFNKIVDFGGNTLQCF